MTKLLLSVPGSILPAAVTKLTGLAALVLDSGMTALPAEHLTGLTSLAIVCAAAEQLPPELASLTNLRQLILEEHLFPGQQDADHLSASLAPLTQLTLLSLARCGLVVMPSAVPALPLLTVSVALCGGSGRRSHTILLRSSDWLVDWLVD